MVLRFGVGGSVVGEAVKGSKSEGKEQDEISCKHTGGRGYFER